jgi:hypothetical protein
MSTPEGKVKERLRTWLRAQNSYYFQPVQTGYGATSLDFLVCMGGQFVGYECKAPGKKLTPRQEYVASEIWTAGGSAFVVTLDNNQLVFAPCGSITKEAS